MTTNDQRIKTLIAQMTLDEKLAQLGSHVIHELLTREELDEGKLSAKLKHGIGQITRMTGASTLDPRSAAGVHNRIQKYLVEETRLGIPAIFHEECCSGAMGVGATAFPQMLGLAATFRPELAESMAAGIRAQLMAVGARQGLAPVLDVARDPRWGRVEETFGEDPTLISHFGAAYIRGLQGDSLSEGVLATAKHFIGHSLSQGGLNCAPVHAGWQEIYEVCMGPFQAAVRAGLGSIMNAYPELDGQVVAASRRILTDILRRELGFDGLVVSDYNAVIMINNFHCLAESLSEAASLALQAGIDVELPTTECYGDHLRKALETGLVNVEAVDEAVRRHLQKKMELGLFEHPYVDEGRVLEVYETEQNRALAREIARQTLVLLKNDGVLPLSRAARTIAVIGPNADDGRNLLGDYSYAAMSEHERDDRRDPFFDQACLAGGAAWAVRVPTVLESIKAQAPSGTQVLYAKGCEVLGDDRSGFDQAVSAAGMADAVVLVLGDRSGMVENCTTGETRDSSDLLLPGAQNELARAVIQTGKPVVIVLVTGRPYAIPWLDEHANAILQAWLPGEEGGAAIAEALFGRINPGGKLPITFPRGVGQIPVFCAAKKSGKKSHWHGDYVTEKVTPLYPFGHGLSYTAFTYRDLLISRQAAGIDDHVDISLMVTNSGATAGDEVVQLYIRDEYASVPRPDKELKGYVRIDLQPGESKFVVFHLPVNQLAFYDHHLHLGVEPGRVQVMIGSSSEDIRLSGQFEISGAGRLPVKERVFVCPLEVRRA
jgi:beta-glucosidase